MKYKKPIIALMYDFDRTLCHEDMQNYNFIPNLGMTPKEFWEETGAFSKKTGCERILSYMYTMIRKSEELEKPITKDYLKHLGTLIPFYNGVETWFKRINEYGKQHGVKIEHYIISSGTKEVILGTSIAKEFKQIYACEFIYNKEGHPIWPKLSINYTQKTQYVFRISKGITNVTEDNELNAKTKNRRIPYSNMIYLGDGMTDVPCMALVKEAGGKSIAIYSEDRHDSVLNLVHDDRVNYLCKADYSKNSELERVVKLVISGVAIQETLAIKERRSRE